MEKEKAKVNRYKSGVKNPEREVLVYSGEDKVVVHIVDWEKGKVATLRKGEEKS